jgi:hypothetical protein
MSARQLRRSFAAPFVITLATALPMAAACGPKPLPKHHNPPGPAGAGPHTNPPAPEAGSGSGSAAEEHHDHHDHEPAAPGPATSAPLASTEPAAKFDQNWTVMKIKGNPDCMAMVDVNCPKPEPGKAVPTCNPPPPIKYACPSSLKDGETMKIVLRAGATDCFIDPGPTRCPDNAKCNPPPPRKVACPER